MFRLIISLSLFIREAKVVHYYCFIYKTLINCNMNMFTWIILIYDCVFFNFINARYIIPYNDAIDSHWVLWVDDVIVWEELSSHFLSISRAVTALYQTSLYEKYLHQIENNPLTIFSCFAFRVCLIMVNILGSMGGESPGVSSEDHPINFTPLGDVICSGSH